MTPKEAGEACSVSEAKAGRLRGLLGSSEAKER
jgi:hypothetical protein